MKNYALFYALLQKVPATISKEDLKISLCLQFSNNRTEHISQLTAAEYKQLCTYLDREVNNTQERRDMRSIALKLMQQLGIDTTCWQRINAFCQDKRICGKPFAALSVEELKKLHLRLRSISHNGGLKTHTTKQNKTIIAINQNIAS